MKKDDAYQRAEQKIEQARQQNATRLDLSWMGMTSLPESLGKLVQLQWLDLSHNNLTTLPEILSNLTNLKKLVVCYNKLQALPANICDLYNLEHLDIGVNKISSFPPIIGNMHALKELRAGANQISELPSDFFNLSNLTDLWLSSNHLRTIPPEINQLTALSILYLHNNKLLGLPPEILGNTWSDVRDKGAKPPEAKRILEYYFRDVPLIREKLVSKTSLNKRPIEDETTPREKKREVESRDVRLFYCYSHKDETLRNELETHLTILKRLDLIKGWHDRCIDAGQELDKEIKKHLEEADIVLLLVSANFITSYYCYNIEMKTAMSRHEAGEAQVIPIILRDSNWKSAPFGKLTALPNDGKPVVRHRPRDKAWSEISEALEDIARNLKKRLQRP